MSKINKLPKIYHGVIAKPFTIVPLPLIVLLNIL